MNQVMLSGVLGRDPEVRYMPNGEAVAKFSVATSERWRDKNSGEMKTATEWHTCIAYAKLGENIAKFFTKGSGILLQGKLKTRKYDDKEGVTRYPTEIIVESFEFPPGPKPANSAGSSSSTAGGQDNKGSNVSGSSLPDPGFSAQDEHEHPF